MKLHIRGGRLVDPSQNVDRKGDVWVEDGKIQALLFGEPPPAKPDQTIDANGAIVAPGLIDLHVHLREPGQEEKEDIASGTHAAVAGGFTSVLCMPNTDPVNDSVEITRWIRKRADETAFCRVFPVGAITKGLKSTELAPLAEMKEAGCVAFSDDGRPVVDSHRMREALEMGRKLNVPMIAHCEDLALSAGPTVNEGRVADRLGLKGIPVAAESADVARVIILAAETGGRLHLAHLSCVSSIQLLREYKPKVKGLTAEATPHHLLLTDEAVLKHGTNAKMYPPLRSSADRSALVKALKDDWIDVIATDHAPHTDLEKKMAYEKAPNGVIGLETALPVLLTLVASGDLMLSQLIRKMSTEPARIVGIPGGTLKPGAPADIVLFSADGERPLSAAGTFSKSRNTPFEGFVGKGRVLGTIVGGEEKFRAEGL
ncbi:MAG TPA: dihydroorotase [Bdellovibrionota bacterium]|nr:dihydroorotase [Bdellovibrionota bacterium]